MKYIVDVGGRSVSLALSPEGIVLGDRALRAALVPVAGAPAFLLTISSEVHEVLVRRGEGVGRYTLWIAGRQHEVEALDERTRTIREMSARSAGPAHAAPLSAPMAGLIVRVLVEAGATVAAGQGLVVMEAMKMENELRAQAAGVVKGICVAQGTAVAKGAVLVEFE